MLSFSGIHKGLNSFPYIICNMVSEQQAARAEGNAGKAIAKPGLRKAFKPDSDANGNCRLGKAAIALMGKGYSRGSKFDEIFKLENLAEKKGIKHNESRFNVNSNDKILHVIVSREGSINYSRLGCAHAGLYSLESLDKAKGGPKVRRQVEEMISSFTKHIRADAGDTVWGAGLFASMHRENQSLLVLRFHSDAIPLSETSDYKAVFFIATTSERMRKDAVAVAEHMVEKEGHLGKWVVLSSETYMNDADQTSQG
jgi:hypothetical protein